MSAPKKQHDDPLQTWLKAQPKFIRELLAGGMAGAISKTSVAPLERAKILYQTHRLPNLGVAGILAHLYKTEGIQGLYRGNSASVLRIVPYAAIHFALYERYKRMIVHSIHTPPAVHHSADPHVQKMAQAAWLEKQHVHPVWDLTAGSAAGASAVLLTYPLDLARTRMAWATDASDSRNQSRRTHTSHHTHTRLKPKAALVTQQQPTQAAVGSASEARLIHSSTPAHQPSTSSHCNISSQSGHLAGRRSRPVVSHGTRAVTATAVTAGSVVLHHHTPHPGLAATLLQTFQNEGSFGLYKGVGPTMLGILPYAGLKFYVYQSLKAMYRKHQHLPTQQQQQQHPIHGDGTKSTAAEKILDTRQLSAVPTSSQHSGRLPVHFMLLFGGVSGLVAQTVTYPLDVIRRTMQVEGYQLEKQVAQLGSHASHKRSTTLSIARRIVAQEGYRGLLRGLYINYMKIFPTTAIGFTVYDHLKQYMDVSGSI